MVSFRYQTGSVLAIRPLYVVSSSRLFDIRVFLLVAKDHAGGSWGFFVVRGSIIVFGLGGDFVAFSFTK